MRRDYDEAVAAILKRHGLVRRNRMIDGILMVLAISGWLLLTAIVLTGCSTAPDRPHGAYGAAPAEGEASPVEQQLGIRVDGITLSAAGYMLDFRYHVNDPEKAAPLLDRKIKPYLLDEASGARFLVPDTPKLGSLRPTSRNHAIQRSGYYMLFANPGRYLKPGSRVSLVLGETRIDHLTVR